MLQIDSQIEELLAYSYEWEEVINLPMPPIPLWVIKEHIQLRLIKVDGKLYCLFHGSSGLKAYIGLFSPSSHGLELVGQQTWTGLDPFSQMTMGERIESLLNGSAYDR